MGIDLITLAESTLEDLYERLEAQFVIPCPDLEIDHCRHELILELPRDQGRFLINIHGVMKEIWMVSPVSGAHHFRYDTQRSTWCDTQSGSTLWDTVAGELTTALNL